MQLNESFFLKAIFVAVAITITFGGAKSFGDVSYIDVEAAMSILKMEIERDKQWAKLSMSRGLLRKVRARLEEDLKIKEPVARKLVRRRDPAIDQAITIFMSTTKDEMEITKGRTVSDRLRRQARRALAGNIPKKEEALSLFEKWSGR